jgi:hypothetical protein
MRMVNEKLRKFRSSSDIIRVIKSGRVRWVRYMAHMGQVHTYIHINTFHRSIIRSRWHEYETGHKRKKNKEKERKEKKGKENYICCDYNLVVIERIQLKQILQYNIQTITQK